MFQQGTSRPSISEDNALIFLGAIPELAAEVQTSRNGACSDARIESVLGHIVFTNMVGMDNKVINQQRDLWLTPEKARNIIIDNIIIAQEEKRVKKQKNRLARDVFVGICFWTFLFV